MQKEIQPEQTERILAHQLAYELTPEQIKRVNGASDSLEAGTSYDTCSGGRSDACDID